MAFAHLHTHSEYSLLDGANRIPDLVARVKELGMDSLAITDHGNLHAAWSFYEEARAQGILRSVDQDRRHGIRSAGQPKIQALNDK